MRNITIECQHLVCLPGGNGIMQHVIFQPTQKTTDALRKAYGSVNGIYSLSIKDAGGEHVSKRLHRFVAMTEDHVEHRQGCIVLTTREC